METLHFSLPAWNIEQETGYKPQTTFWEDFSIADKFGKSGVQDTFNRAFRAWKKNTVYLTELVLVLNHKIWQHYETNEPLARLYDKLWREADEYACDNLKGEDMDYYFHTTD